MKHLFTLLLSFSVFLNAQTNINSNSRQTINTKAQLILHELDYLLYKDTTNNKTPFLEFKNVGESGAPSDKYILYSKLLSTISESEALAILNNDSENAVIRGYAYMAYAYLCAKEKRKEIIFNYDFKLNILSGCLLSTHTFPSFVKLVHTRKQFNPNFIDNKPK